ncbi:MAG: hypothetical protein Q7R77_02740 [Candidatus Daviesbacteria bacterium]|nr:hypothetical protein [Candidatus Daviesbacteria bacterium]
MTKKEWLIAAILTLTTIVAWMIFDVLHAGAKVEVSQKVQEIIEPINPNFNTQIFQSQP